LLAVIQQKTLTLLFAESSSSMRRFNENVYATWRLLAEQCRLATVMLMLACLAAAAAAAAAAAQVMYVRVSITHTRTAD